ncbi:hypothetical protein EVAR_66288_1 [Eumeta japonica]|uniref:Reverse transcriptase domain-containing protein n=1 Tax=Eumeta variegata TaxID=151549 RepID=A0A4C1YV53_EUMVA|nr:hypothetical protein EVAR_66288_1 [Eumeta japonica]
MNRHLTPPLTPLCVLDTAGMIFERIINQRIEEIVDLDLLLGDNQYGFWNTRSNLDAINLVVGTVKKAIAGTRKGGSKKYCLVATLDIRNTFYSANCDCIMQVL